MQSVQELEAKIKEIIKYKEQTRNLGSYDREKILESYKDLIGKTFRSRFRYDTRIGSGSFFISPLPQRRMISYGKKTAHGALSVSASAAALAEKALLLSQNVL